MKKRHNLIQPDEWVKNLSILREGQDVAQIQAVITLYGKEHLPLLQHAVGVADILLNLGLDNVTLTAALLYPLLQVNVIHVEGVSESFGENCQKILHDVLQLQSLGNLQHLIRNHQQIENVRKMLLAMVTDVRAVLMVLAQRLWQLRNAKELESTEQQLLAHEVLNVYAPLANRLGIWQLKWEIEDLCLRYLRPDIYKKIAKGIASKRDEREAYIQQFIATMTTMLHEAGLQHSQVYGRVKHIYSIFSKMQRKNADLEKIYDMSALRVLVDSIDECYTVLSILQSHWQQIPEEFDDYINKPKTNGYRSIHTVIIGPKDHFIEIQIRTKEMHQESELGVAAHWRYKEGVLQTSSYEAKIALLRQIMAWQKEVVDQSKENTQTMAPDLFADRVYVFTPNGDILDLPQGSTPLDFAYQIHSEIGHRCKGAKIAGQIVPLTTTLQTGDKIEILTGKEANPSRDWLNPHLGYLKSSRSRAKVLHWFRLKDSDQHGVEGKEILEKELKKQGIQIKLDLHSLAEKFNLKNGEALLAAIGAGDIRVSQVLHVIQPQVSLPPETKMEVKPPVNETSSHIQISGMNNLLTHVARCCKPLPGDEIIGYVTRHRGVTIHRKDCSNFRNVSHVNVQRAIDVKWGEDDLTKYSADILLRVQDRAGLLRDVTTFLASEKINVLALQTHKIAESHEANINVTIEINNRQQLKRALSGLQEIVNVLEVRRR